MGLKSGVPGGRKQHFHCLDAITARTSFVLWNDTLSITMTVPEDSCMPSMNFANVSELKGFDL